MVRAYFGAKKIRSPGGKTHYSSQHPAQSAWVRGSIIRGLHAVCWTVDLHRALACGRRSQSVEGLNVLLTIFAGRTVKCGASASHVASARCSSINVEGMCRIAAPNPAASSVDLICTHHPSRVQHRPYCTGKSQLGRIGYIKSFALSQMFRLFAFAEGRRAF